MHSGGNVLSFCPCAHPELIAFEIYGSFSFPPKYVTSPTSGLSKLWIQAGISSFTFVFWLGSISGGIWMVSIDLCFCCFSFHLVFFQLPCPSPMCFLVFPSPPSWHAERGFVTFDLSSGVHSWHRRFGHLFYYFWLLCTLQGNVWLSPAISLSLSVALNFSVLCPGCCRSLQVHA